MVARGNPHTKHFRALIILKFWICCWGVAGRPLDPPTEPFKNGARASAVCTKRRPPDHNQISTGPPPTHTGPLILRRAKNMFF